MPELPPPAAQYETPQTPVTASRLGSRLLGAAIPPVVLATVFGMAAVAYLLFKPDTASAAVSWTVAGVALAASLVAIAVAALRIRPIVHDFQGRISQLRHWNIRHREELRQLTEQLGRGETPRPLNIEAPVIHGDEFAELHNDLMATRHAALTAITSLPRPAAAETSIMGIAMPAPSADARAEVFVNLARRLQALLHREIQLLDELESQVEDPDFLKGLFAIDHLATRIRRHAENLAVLGGAGNRRQWSHPVEVNDILRSAVAEIEQYVRVKLVRPLEGSVQGHAVADVVHLVAELVENATRFSAPHTNVLLRTERVTAGLAVEVEDRGLGIPRDDQTKINVMLRTPDVVNFDELLRDGRIGLFVVGALARRHNIAVQVQTNIFGGTQSVLVIPNELLGDDTPKPEPVAAAAPTGDEGRAITTPSAAEQLAMTQEMAAVSAPPAYETPVSRPGPADSAAPPDPAHNPSPAGSGIPAVEARSAPEPSPGFTAASEPVGSDAATPVMTFSSAASPEPTSPTATSSPYGATEAATTDAVSSDSAPPSPYGTSATATTDAASPTAPSYGTAETTATDTVSPAASPSSYGTSTSTAAAPSPASPSYGVSASAATDTAPSGPTFTPATSSEPPSLNADTPADSPSAPPRPHAADAIAGARQTRPLSTDTTLDATGTEPAEPHHSPADPLPDPVAGLEPMSRSLFDTTPAEPSPEPGANGFEPVRPRSAPPADSRPSPRPRPSPVTATDASTQPGRGELSWSSPAPSPRPRPAEDDRPSLPQRRRQESLAPQLREAPVPAQVADAVKEEDSGHDPGLMSAFQRGMDRADDGDDDTSPDN